MLNKVADLAPEICHGVKGGATDRLVCDQREPTLDLIEPGAVGWGEVQMKARPAHQPGPYPGMFVRAVVVADQMNIEVLRDVGLDVAQEAEKLLVPMSRLALSQDAAVGHIKSCEERRGAMADVIVGDALDIAQSHRQDWLCALKRLHLTFSSTHRTRAFCGGLR